MKIYYSVILVLATVLSAFTISKDPKIVKAEEFQKHINPIGLIYLMSSGYKETFVTENKDLKYDFAIKSENADFEVRYTIWSLKPTLEEYKKCKLDKNCTMVNPNSIYQGIVEANVLNMTAGLDADIGPFPPMAVREEFNADSGGSSFFAFDCEFGKGGINTDKWFTRIKIM